MVEVEIFGGVHYTCHYEDTKNKCSECFNSPKAGEVKLLKVPSYIVYTLLYSSTSHSNMNPPQPCSLTIL